MTVIVVNALWMPTAQKHVSVYHAIITKTPTLVIHWKQMVVTVIIVRRVRVMFVHQVVQTLNTPAIPWDRWDTLVVSLKKIINVIAMVVTVQL